MFLIIYFKFRVLGWKNVKQKKREKVKNLLKISGSLKSGTVEYFDFETVFFFKKLSSYELIDSHKILTSNIFLAN